MKHGWSQNSIEWEESKKIIQTCNWVKHEFSSIRAIHIPDTSGIYILCSNPPINTGKQGEPIDVFYNALYVGKSTNLKRRFKEHLSKPEREIQTIVKLYKNIDYWFVEVEEDKLDIYERTLIKILGPVGNKVNGSEKNETIIQATICDEVI